MVALRGVQIYAGQQCSQATSLVQPTLYELVSMCRLERDLKQGVRTDHFRHLLKHQDHQVYSEVNMKTLSLTVGLLLVLFTAYYDASKAVNSPDFCCFEFFDKRIPKAHIVNITKTHSQCSTPAFVVETPKRLLCVKQSEDWALREFVKRAQ
ncbi:C-C motif chemokine 3 [Oreochromis niloticus]|uniref:C-C motif chemokine 3 n=1 Tax=Oreochromis niloticus TaxID=8128 RepID=UPI00090539EA|nr:C-C motif chemokine 3 [Oreochromis niloticus]